jgi:hypothetical protein
MNATKFAIVFGVIVLAAVVGYLSGWAEVTHKMPNSSGDEKFLVALVSSAVCAVLASVVMGIAMLFERRKTR